MILDSGKYYLYRHIRMDKDRPFYIGIGTKKSFIKDWNMNSAYYRAFEKGNRNKIWWDIVNKAEYEVEILLESNNYDFIKEKEVEFIKLYGRINTKTGILSNLTDGGEGEPGKIVSKETREKQSIARKGKPSKLKGVNYHSQETKDYLGKIQLGKKLSVESISKRTETRRRNSTINGWHSKETKEAIRKGNSKIVYCTDLTTNEVMEYTSCHDAHRKLGISFQNISKWAKNERIKDNFKWSYNK